MFKKKQRKKITIDFGNKPILVHFFKNLEKQKGWGAVSLFIKNSLEKTVKPTKQQELELIADEIRQLNKILFEAGERRKKCIAILESHGMEWVAGGDYYAIKEGL